jgi:hypothetical protein
MVAAESRRIRLGELLLRAGVITEEQLRNALTEQKKWGGKLGSVLVDMNLLDEDMLVKALSKQLGLPRVDFKGLVIQPPALKKLDAEFADQRQVLPISLDVSKGLLVVAMADPHNLELVDEIAFRSGCRIKVAIAGERALAQAIREHYYGDNVTAAESAPDDEMKLINPQGNTLVRRVADIEAEGRAQQSGAAAEPAAPAAPGAEPPLTIDKRLERLEQMQRKEVQVLKTIVELLIAKGYITREEYRQRVDS